MTESKRFKRNEPQVSFSKIHVPKMRSVFWKYFGFPSNENDEIITKQKVVCTLCNAVLTNHYNTTNIRAHMQSTHKQIFADLIETHGIQVPPRKTPKKARTISKSELNTFDDSMHGDEEQQSIKQEQMNYCSSSALHEEDSINLLEAIPLTYDDTDRASKEDFSDGETSNNFLEQTSTTLISPTDRSPKHKPLAPLNITVDINPIQMPIVYDVEESLCKMIVKDLHNVSTIYDSGMEELLIGLLSNQVFPSMRKIETALKQVHSEKFNKLKDRIKIHSQVKLYSISFDVWSNIEGKQFVSIYFNNISEEYENQFCDNLYMTVELNNYTMFDQIFDDFNLENCSAAVINCNHKILNTFLSSSDIPIIHCFSYILNSCIEDVFKIPEVWSILDEVKDVIARYAPEICSEDVEIPIIHKDFPMTKVVLLKFFCESVSWPEELDFLISKAKNILDALTPLEVTLDTLKEEDIPLSSLFLPFADKIIKKHFKINEDDDLLIQEIKSRIVKEFKSSVCSNNHLTLTALLDPRFHKFLTIKNLNTCVSILDKKYAQISKQRGYLQKCEAAKTEDVQRSSKKTHLKMFFDCPDAPAKQPKSETLIESDLRRYREEACASLEDSPLLWWNQWGNIYGSLKHLADAYNCILGFVNMGLKNPLKDQIKFHQKRFMLTGKLIDQIVFLNKNC